MRPRLPRWLAMPLLGRELIESANRRRTYALRSAAALVALGVCGFSLSEFLGLMERYRGYQGMTSAITLGIGRYLVVALSQAQLGIIWFLLPAMGAVSVTQEKEQGTLVLLLLTLMRPWQLVLQKWLALCLLMLGMLLVVLPLYGVAYAYGGIDADLVLAQVLAILTAVTVAAATSLAVGCWSRSTTGAIILSYLALLGLYVLWPLATTGHAGPFAIQHYLSWNHHYQPGLADYANPLMLMDLWEAHGANQWFVLVPLVITVLMLVLARIGIVRRADSTGGFGLLGALRWLDAFFARLELRLMRRQTGRSLPVRSPVHWLEVNRRSLTNARYLVRLLLPWYLLLLMVCLGLHDDLDAVYAASLSLVLLMTAVWHAGLLASERSQQTLDVLLTSPLSTASILSQKMRALARLRWGMSGSLVLVVLISAFLQPLAIDPNAAFRLGPISMQNLTRIAGAIILPALVGWLSLAIGLVTSQHRRAAVTALITTAVWLAGLPLALVLLLQLTGASLAGHDLLLLAPGVVACDSSLATGGNRILLHGRDSGAATGLLIMGLLYLGLWVVLRSACLQAGHWLLQRSRAAR